MEPRYSAGAAGFVVAGLLPDSDLALLSDVEPPSDVAPPSLPSLLLGLAPLPLMPLDRLSVT